MPFSSWRWAGGPASALFVLLALSACGRTPPAAVRQTQLVVRELQPAPGALALPLRDASVRFAVIGDSDFAANGGLGIQGNRDLFMNTVGWLSQQENLISIRPKEADDRRLNPMPAATQAMIMYGAWLGMPLLIFGVGIYSWWRRR